MIFKIILHLRCTAVNQSFRCFISCRQGGGGAVGLRGVTTTIPCARTRTFEDRSDPKRIEPRAFCLTA